MQGLAVVVALASLLIPRLTSSQPCESLEQSLAPLLRGPSDAATFTLRRVELMTGRDNVSCLNAGREKDPPPCRTLEYALQPAPDAQVYTWL